MTPTQAIERLQLMAEAEIIEMSPIECEALELACEALAGLRALGGDVDIDRATRRVRVDPRIVPERNWDSMPPDAGIDADCELCEQENELEPGTFTPHEHGGGPWGRITVASEPPEVAQRFEQTEIQTFGVDRVAYAKARMRLCECGAQPPCAPGKCPSTNLLPRRCRSERFMNRVGDPGRCVLARGHAGVHSDGKGTVWTDAP